MSLSPSSQLQAKQFQNGNDVTPGVTLSNTDASGDVDMTTPEDDIPDITGCSSGAEKSPVEDTPPSPSVTANEPRIPTKKDATLREFLSKMNEYSPIIPDAVVNYYLTLAGLPPPPQTPLPLARLLALATQKFVADIATDAYQYSRIRYSNASASNALGGLGPAGVFGMATSATSATPGGANIVGSSNLGNSGNIQANSKESGNSVTANKSILLGMQRPGFGAAGQVNSQGRTVLTLEDLGMAVAEYGVNVKRGEFYR